MITKPDGRTIKGLRHQKAALGKNEHTLDEANQLEQIDADIEAATVFHEGVLETALDEDLFKSIDRIWPKINESEVKQSVYNLLLSRHLTIVRRDKDIVALHTACDPWICDKYNPKKPSVGSQPNLQEGTKIAVCSRVYFRETIVCLIMQAPTSCSLLIDLCSECLKRFGEHDVIDMSSDGTRALKVYLNSVKYVLTLLDKTLGLKYKD